jgi:hypothetical protein
MKHTENLEQYVSLLGKSERDGAVKEMLTCYRVKQPIPRPERGDSTTNISLESSFQIEFIFKLAEFMENYTRDHLEGELVFVNLVYWPTDQDIANEIVFPLGVKVQASQEDQFKIFGEPSWRNDNWGLYAWEFGKLKVSLHYKGEKKNLYEICYFINPDVKL